MMLWDVNIHDYCGTANFGQWPTGNTDEERFCLQVDLGALGGVPSDLEQSIMMRQRSLSSRASMDDSTH